MNVDSEVIVLDSSSSEAEDENDDEDILEVKLPAQKEPEIITLEDSDSEPKEESDDEDDIEIDPNEKRTKLFVNYIPQELSDEEFTALFMEIGPLNESFIFRDRVTNYSYGYGKVDYECPEDAARAIKQLNHTEIQGKKLKVVYSLERNGTSGGYSNLYFQNVPMEVSQEEIQKTFALFGETMQFKLLRNIDGSSQGRGFVRFCNRFQAIMAIRQLNGQKTFGKEGQTLLVKFAEEHGKAKAGIYFNLVRRAKNFRRDRFGALKILKQRRQFSRGIKNFHNQGAFFGNTLY